MGRDKALLWHPPLLQAFRRFGITNARRQALFLAQALHESGGLEFLQELWGPTEAQRGYEGRKDLGNTRPGDGYRYRGRGLFQLTGRNNYRKAGQAFSQPFEAQPELVATPWWAALTAAWFWSSRFTWDGIRPVVGLNYWADRGNLERVTRAINGGANGLDRRREWWEKAKKALQVS